MKTEEKREKKVLMLKSCAAVPSKAQSPRMPINWMLLGMYIWIQSTADTDMYLLHADISTAK